MTDANTNLEGFQRIKIQFPPIKCFSHKQCRYVCINPKCKKIAFQCMHQDCQSCQKQHNNCKLYSLKGIFQKLNQKKQDYTDNERAAIQKINKNFDELVAQIQLQKKHINEKLVYFGLNNAEIKLLRKIYSDTNYQLTGKDFFQIIPTIYQVRKMAPVMQQISAYWLKQKNNVFKKLTEMVDILNTSRCEFNSKITRRIDLIEKFLPKNYKGIKLLYRASQNRFSVDGFHKYCDRKIDTLILAKTISGKIIGAFTANNFWYNIQTSSVDGDGKTFLFSLSCNEKYPFIMESRRTHAVFSSAKQGPQFGKQKDFFICNNANDQNCKFMIGNSYMIDNPCSSETYQKFCGSSTGSCKLKQWEVFQVYFNTQHEDEFLGCNLFDE